VIHVYTSLESIKNYIGGILKRRNPSRIICDRKVPNKLKGKFEHINSQSIILCNCECWALKLL